MNRSGINWLAEMVECNGPGRRQLVSEINVGREAVMRDGLLPVCCAGDCAGFFIMLRPMASLAG